MPLYAQIAIPSPLHRLFTYKIPQDFCDKLKVGMRVAVPFRKKHIVGFCLGFTQNLVDGLEEKSLKEIAALLDSEPIFSPTMIRFIEWLADYYFAPIGEVCSSALPNRLSQIKNSQRTKPRLAEESHSHFHQSPHLLLTDEQQKALDFLLSTKDLKPILLHGVTGSGKTEIYLQFLLSLLEQNRQAILLVPEISLTPQLIGRVQSRLGRPIAIYHSGLSESWRQLYWEKMRSGEISVVVGTRSALFAPFKNLGAIIIDEEQDSSYKQSEGLFHYHARDGAIVRAKLEGAQVILGSATPSLESFHNAKRGKYHYIYLSRRATGAKLPQIELIDLRKNRFVKNSKTLSLPLKDAISETLYRGEQTLLLLNRRGFANFLLCQDCGATMECPNCAISLTYHKAKSGMLCHYCDYKTDVPQICAKCQSPALSPLGQGTETLEEELKDFFPSAVIARLDRDTSQKRGARNQMLSEMKSGRVDILLGTQIIAKGHDFQNITLVGVILADTTLHLPDFRSSERTFQLLSQVAGRAGRGDKPGKVIIQTFYPEHFALLQAQGHNFETFSITELQARKSLMYPPFSRLAQIRLQSTNEKKVEETAKALKDYISGGGSVLGPAKNPIPKVNGKYRWQFLIKGNHQQLRAILKQTQIFSQTHLPSQVQLQIDVDALNWI